MLILIMAGGTGGHVYPALAIAKRFQELNHKVVWLGSVKGMENKIVAKNNILFDKIKVSGLRGKGFKSWLLAPINLVRALLSAVLIIKKRNPDLIIGMGGFVSGPGAVAAKLLNKSLVIHEQNSIAGLTNKILRPIAKLSLQAFPNTLKNSTTVGNPVREDICQIQPKKADKLLNVLIFGGSLGAQIFNEIIPKVYQKLSTEINIWHQTGKNKLAKTLKEYQDCEKSCENIKVVEFIDDMADAFSWADLVICRSGAMTVFELAASGKASILVPYPFAVDNHQTSNAEYLTKKNAAILLDQKHLSVEVLTKHIQELLNDKSKIETMSKNAKSCAFINSTQKIVDLCLEEVG